MRAATTCRPSRRRTPAPTYDEALRANFLQKMNYLIDTLYDLSQKSGRPAKAGGAFNADPTAVPPGPGRTGYDSNLRAGAIRTDYWNWGTGFISAYPPDQFIMLEQGATYGTQDTPDLGPLLHAAQDPRRPARLLRGGRQPQGPRDRRGHGRLGVRAAEGPPGRDAHQHVEPLHRRRVRRHERGDGAPVPAHRRPAVPRVREAVRQHQLLLRQRGPRPRPGEERGHDSRQARQPAHPADHRGARDLPRHAASCRTTRSPTTSGTSRPTTTCTASAAWPAPARRTTRSASPPSPIRCGRTASPAAGRTRPAPPTTC